MTLLFRVIYAAHAKGTHHKLALDGLAHLDGIHVESWRRLFLKHANVFMLGAKAPDDEFKDFVNHVLHPRDGFWGGAPAKARSWYGHVVTALRQRDWSTAAYAAGVLSHYVTDPIHPFHTAQSEAENAIHRATEWSINRAYDSLRAEALGHAPPHEFVMPDGDNWLEVLLCDGAALANTQYERLIAHYDIHRGVVDPPTGLDPVARRLVGELLLVAAALFGRVLQRAIDEAEVAPPEVSLTLDTVLATIKAPLAMWAKRLGDADDRRQVEAMYDELQATGRVHHTLPADDKAVAEAHAREVLARKTAVEPVKLFPGPAQPVETAVERSQRLKREAAEKAKAAAMAKVAERAAERAREPTAEPVPQRPAPISPPPAAVKPAVPPAPPAVPTDAVPSGPGSDAAAAPSTGMSGLLARLRSSSPGGVPVAAGGTKPPAPPQLDPPAPKARAAEPAARPDKGAGMTLPMPPRPAIAASPVADVRPDVAQTPHAKPAAAATGGSVPGIPLPSVPQGAARPAPPAAEAVPVAAGPVGVSGEAKTVRPDPGAAAVPNAALPAPRQVPAPTPAAGGEPERGDRPTADRSPREVLAAMPAVQSGKIASIDPAAQDSRPAPRRYLDRNQQVADAPSIGPKTADRLRSARIRTVGDLLDADPDTVARTLNNRQFTAATIRDWQAQAQLVIDVPGLRGTHAQLLVGAGLRTRAEVAETPADQVCARVLAFAGTEEGQRVLRQGDPPDIERIKVWVEHARQAQAA